MLLSAVLFDLGSTLVYSKDPWLPIYEQADLALLNILRQAGIKINSASFYKDFGGFIQSYYEYKPVDNLETTTFTYLRNWLSKHDFPIPPEMVIRNALNAFYSVTQTNWILENDAIYTLESLKSAGYVLGLVSNTSDDSNVRGIIDHWKLSPFFNTIVTSASLGIRKPDARIFKVALNEIQVQPEAAVMVGDTLAADILGANLMGIYSIWVTRRAETPREGELAIQPEAVVTELRQIPDLLEEVRNERIKEN